MSARGSSLRIVVAGLVGAYPVGGVAWDYLQYPIGLARLGHDVIYHEDTWTWPFDPRQNARVETASYSADFLRGFFERYAPQLANRWHYRHLSSESFGMSHSQFLRYAQSADLFLNVSAANPIPVDLAPACVTAFLDTDPGYNQIVLSERPEWSENVERWFHDFKAHTCHLTYAENIGQADCLTPQLGVRWIPTRMPIVLSFWNDLSEAAEGTPWSTVMTWNDFRGRLVFGGREYGSKSMEFSRIRSLPSKTSTAVRIAIGGSAAPVQELMKDGWRVLDGPAATLTPQKYREFIGESRGEVSTAKNVYVAMNTGWFSCRTACYLAAGRPAVVQNTGFSKYIPTGNGLLAFDTVEQASSGIAAVEANYHAHATSARELAAEYFDSAKVLDQMLNAIFAK
jgi:hypothetical protein